MPAEAFKEATVGANAEMNTLTRVQHATVGNPKWKV
jgi:hypothetical protein